MHTPAWNHIPNGNLHLATCFHSGWYMPIRLEECPRQLEGGLPLNPHGGLPQTLLNTSSLRALTVALSEARVRDGTVDCETDREGREKKKRNNGQLEGAHALLSPSHLIQIVHAHLFPFPPIITDCACRA